MRQREGETEGREKAGKKVGAAEEWKSFSVLWSCERLREERGERERGERRESKKVRERKERRESKRARERERRERREEG